MRAQMPGTCHRHAHVCTHMPRVRMWQATALATRLPVACACHVHARVLCTHTHTHFTRNHAQAMCVQMLGKAFAMHMYGPGVRTCLPCA